MSRQNKVNPGQYTQRGRLTPDDAAREAAKQRHASPGPEPREAATPKRPETGEDTQDEEQ